MVRYPALAAVLAILTTSSAAAQEHPGRHQAAPPPHPQPVRAPYYAHPPAARSAPAARPVSTQFHGPRFIQALGAVNLSVDQRDRIRSLVESTRQANQNADPQTRRENIQKMRAGIWQTLSPEQQSLFRSELNKPGEPGELP